MGKRSAIELDQPERDSLSRIIKRGHNWRARQRAQTLIYLDDGISKGEVAELLGVNVRTVGSTRTAWLDCGGDSLYDTPRCEVPQKLSEQELQGVVTLAGATPLTANGLLALLADGQPVHMAKLTAALKAAGLVWTRIRESLKIGESSGVPLPASRDRLVARARPSQGDWLGLCR
jgi:transposase